MKVISNIPEEKKPEFTTDFKSLVISPDYVLIHIKKEYKKNGVTLSSVPNGTRYKVIKAGKNVLEQYPDIIGSWILPDTQGCETEKIDGEEYGYIQFYRILSYCKHDLV